MQMAAQKIKEDEPFSRNIGQDLIRKFDMMTMNFD